MRIHQSSPPPARNPNPGDARWRHTVGCSRRGSTIAACAFAPWGRSLPHGCCWARAAGRCGTPPPSTWPTSAAAARWRRCSSSTRRCSAGSTPCRARAAFSRPPPPVRPRPLALPLPLLLCSLGLLATAPSPAPERWLGCMSFPSGMTPDPTCPTHPRVQARSSWSRLYPSSGAPDGRGDDAAQRRAAAAVGQRV